MATFETASSKVDLVTKVPSNGNGGGAVSVAEPELDAAPSMVPSRMIRFGIVGCIGIVVNLIVLAAILHNFHTRAWWASTIANFVATLHNYILNNLWTFRDRTRKGRGFFRGCLLYFAVATMGIGLTTVAFIVFKRVAADLMQSAIVLLPAWVALLCQLAAILVGTSFNYLVNKTITWRLHTLPIE